MLIRALVSSGLLLSLHGLGGMAGQDWNAADLATVRIKPAAFPRAPADVRAEMERRGCTVPQPHGATRPANLLSGRFTSAGQTDWAGLCSRNRISVILVFRGGSTTDVAELARQPDRSYLQRLGRGIIGFSRGLGIADPAYIRGHHDARSKPPLPILDHDGINDIFIEKGSVVWFWSQGRWLELAGSD
jgi:hypothetical protein